MRDLGLHGKNNALQGGSYKLILFTLLLGCHKFLMASTCTYDVLEGPCDVRGEP